MPNNFIMLMAKTSHSALIPLLRGNPLSLFQTVLVFISIFLYNPYIRLNHKKLPFL